MAHQDEGRCCAAASIRLTLPVPISYTAPTTFTFPCCTKRLKTGSAVLRRCAFSRTFSTIARSTRSGAEGSVFFKFWRFHQIGPGRGCFFYIPDRWLEGLDQMRQVSRQRGILLDDLQGRLDRAAVAMSQNHHQRDG